MTLRPFAAPSLLACLGAVVLHASPAFAAEPSITVRAEGCGELDTNEVALLLELELTDMAGSWDELDAPPVTLSCAGPAIRIAVQDPVTGKRLARAIPHPETTVQGRERALALAVSQLFLTSWLELLLPAEQRPFLPERPAPEVLAATERARVAVAERSAARPAPAAPAPAPAGPPEPPSLLRPRLSILGGLRLRDLRAPYVAVVGGVRVGIEVWERWNLFAQAAFEDGQATRQIGNVNVTVGDFGVGTGLRLRLSDHFAIDTAAVFSALYVRIRGEARRQLVRAKSTHSAAAQAAITVGPTFELAPFRLGLALSGGVTLFGVEGVVEGETSVRPNGPFVGAHLTLDVVL